MQPLPTSSTPTATALTAALSHSLRTLLLDGNCLSSLAPLAAMSCLEALSAARNSLRGLRGLEPLLGLLRLDVSGNLIGRLEDVGPVAGASLLGDLDLRGNDLEQVGGLHCRRRWLPPAVG